MEKVVLAWSGGKDSAISLYGIQRDGKYEIVALLTTMTRDYERVSMHGVRRSLVQGQARSVGIPLEEVLISKSCSNEEYDCAMRDVLSKFKKIGVLSVVFGDIFLEGIRSYREGNLAKIGMKGIFPLWGWNTAVLTRDFIAAGFEAVITCVDTRVLDRRFAGRIIDEPLLAELPSSVDPGGENGEYHSFVFDGPVFKQRIKYTLGESVENNPFYFRDLIPKPIP